MRSSEQTGQERNNGGADQGNTAAGHQLLDALGLRAGVIVAVTLEQVYQTPDAEAGTDRSHEGLQYFNSRTKRKPYSFPPIK